MAMSVPFLRSAAEWAAERPLSPGEALGVLRDAAQALAALHAAGGVHGAVCAENLVLDERGAARLCRDRAVAPAPSPEQRRGERPDARSDVYGLGRAMADLLGDAGSLPEPIVRLLAMMMAEEPEQRYQSMGEVLMALEACELLTGHQAARPGARPATAGPRTRWLALAVLALSLAVLGLAMLGLLGRTLPARGTPPPAEAELKPLLERAVPLPPKAEAPARR